MYFGQLIIAVIPALNEEASIKHVIEGLLSQRNENKQTLVDSIIVCDNGSSDRTAEYAKQAGAHVVYEPNKGYGAACLKSINAIEKADIIVFIDADHSANTDELAHLLKPFQCLPPIDLVIGSRTLGTIQTGALSLPQTVGNKLASYIIKHLWQHPTTDLGPFRAIRWASLQTLNMQNTRFGWTVEMQVKAIQANMHTKEVPVSTRARIGQSKISGTFKGVIGAAYGILSTIFILWWQQAPYVGIQESTHHEID